MADIKPIPPNSARNADIEALVKRSMNNGYQLLSFLTPPLYTAFVLTRRPGGWNAFSLNRLLRATWVGGAVGAVGGGTFEWIRSDSSNDEYIQHRRLRAAYNTSALRANDHATIGGLLFAVLTPAIFWKKAGIAHLILGGAGIGSSVGLIAHYGRTIFGDPAPSVAIPPFAA